MRRHDRIGVEVGAERRELARLEHLARGVAARKRKMRVEHGVAVTREMLEAGRRTGVTEATQCRGDRGGHGLRRGAERARSDDRIPRLARHVGDRCERPVDAERTTAMAPAAWS